MRALVVMPTKGETSQRIPDDLRGRLVGFRPVSTALPRTSSAPIAGLRVSGLAVLAAALLAGCGSASKTSSSTTSTTQQAVTPQIQAALHVRARDFPPTQGQALQAIANQAKPGPLFGPATSVFVPGVDRLGFGLIDRSNAFVYGPSVVYIARNPSSPARGPYPAPLDLMVTPPQFQSRTVANDPRAPKAIYAAQVPFPSPGNYAVLVLTRVNGALLGATTQQAVTRTSPIPAVGQRPPLVDTPTLASVHGDVAKIDTRIPPDDMHRVSFKNVVGKRPVALLFATPALCTSRTCGPVTDIAVEMERQYGSQMTFIHNEVYVDNMPLKGYRPQLKAFHLQTEPWLFTVNRQGRIAARLEGAFGVNAFRQAVQAALR